MCCNGPGASTEILLRASQVFEPLGGGNIEWVAEFINFKSNNEAILFLGGPVLLWPRFDCSVRNDPNADDSVLSRRSSTFNYPKAITDQGLRTERFGSKEFSITGVGPAFFGVVIAKVVIHDSSFSA